MPHILLLILTNLSTSCLMLLKVKRQKKTWMRDVHDFSPHSKTSFSWLTLIDTVLLFRKEHKICWGHIQLDFKTIFKPESVFFNNLKYMQNPIWNSDISLVHKVWWPAFNCDCFVVQMRTQTFRTPWGYIFRY